MPTLTEARGKVRELSQKGLDVLTDEKLTFAEQKAKSDDIDVELKRWMDEVQSLEQVDERRKSFMAAAGAPVEDAAAEQAKPETRSFGRQFVDSRGYKAFRGIENKTSAWTTGSIELKTLLAEGTAGTPGPGFAPVMTPTVLPGVLPILFQPLTVASLFAQGTTSTPIIRYLVETAVTNAAAAVAEAGLKPESAITLSNVDETLHKIATFLPVTDEMLEDYDQIQSYIDNRLQLFVQIQEEAQLLSGNGTAPNLTGILNRPGLQPALVARAGGSTPSPSTDNDMDAILRQITLIRTKSFLNPDSIVMNPTDWQTILLAKNGQGQYYANGPFADATNPSLWGLKVVATTAIAQGTALVGAFKQGGQVFRKGGLTVEASNSHANFFQTNMVAIRAEERIALAIYRPGAFGVVSSL